MRKHIIWLYSVVVALVIREAISEVIPLFTKSLTPLEHVDFTNALYVLRAGVVVLVVIRFYLGAAVVLPIRLKNDSTPMNEAVCFTSGMTHFILFFAWASTVNSIYVDTSGYRLSPFEVVMLLVLVYDLVWLMVSPGHRFKELRLWTGLNLATALVCLVLHFSLKGFTHHARVVESIVFVPLVFVSIVDIIQMFAQRELIRGGIESALL